MGSVVEQMKTLARESLSNIPAEVCELWLYDRVATNGWPPTGVEWQGFLFNRPLSYWQGLSWDEQCISLSEDNIGDYSTELILALLGAHVGGLDNGVNEYMPDSKARYEAINQYLGERSEIPGKIILLEQSGKFEVLDGAHRVTAALVYQANNPDQKLSIDAWVARNN